MKPVLVVYGDCQGQVIARAIIGEPLVTDRYDVRFVPRPRNGELEFDRELWERCEIFWQQVGTDFMSDEDNVLQTEFFSQVPAQVKTVRYPAVYFNTLWPDHRWDPLFTADLVRLFPYSDALLIKLSTSSVLDADLFEKYLEMSSQSAQLLPRLYERNIALLAERDQKCNVKMTGFIASQYRVRNLFWTFNHPTNLLTREVVSRLAAATWPQETRVGAPMHDLGQRCQVLRRSEPLRLYEYPISPVIAEQAGLSWYSPETLYLLDDSKDGRRVFTVREYVEAFVPMRRKLEEQRGLTNAV